MLIETPIHSRNAVSENVIPVTLIPLQYIAHLFTKFPKISVDDTSIAVQQTDFVVPKPLLKGQLRKSRFIILSQCRGQIERLNSFPNNALLCSQRFIQMNITTHAVVAFVLGIVLFRNVELALIMSMGAVIPDLDREYFYLKRDRYRALQLHRAALHNFVVAGILWVANPLLALGALSHYFLDIFTSATDRGIEFLFPFTRVVGTWLYGIEGETKNGVKMFKYTVKEKKTGEKKLQWWVEDPWRLLYQTSEVDLFEPNPQPWRRSYGPFRNSKIVDWGIFVGSVLFLLLLLVPATSRTTFYSSLGLDLLHGFWFGLAFGSIALFFWLGERSRKQSAEPQLKLTNWPVDAALLVAVILFFLGGLLGGVFSVHLPSTIATDVLGAGVGSIAIGLILSYGYRKMRKSEDLSL